MASELKKKVELAASYLRKNTGDFTPEVGIILGTGLGTLANEIVKFKVIDYADIPDFPVSTVETHHGKMVFGELGGKKVVAMQGRFHCYEGYTMQQVTFPVRVMKALGIKYLLISNAAGGLNLKLKAASMLLIEDHISLFLGDNPLMGPNDEELGPRWPDMLQPYDRGLMQIAEKAAKDMKLKLHKGVYVGVLGPNFETRAEYRMINKFGDVVGMSTVPEVIVAAHAGIKVMAVSVITDMCNPDQLEPTDIKQILKNAAETEPKLTAL
ncbi:MAG: purine-nucleoside phosphorylase, partial [Spirochaetia bacterium]|nr:purine-nucleoside phosphorylase [Spirochaetia bacterium]